MLKNEYMNLKMGIGDWGLGIGDWGLGPIPNPQSPIPNPQSPKKIIKIINFLFKYYYIKIFININIYNSKTFLIKK